MTAVLAFDHVRVARGTRVLVDDLTLAVVPGEIVGVVGPNGAGKSTLLAVVLGELALARGTASFPGVARGRPRIALIPQADGLDAVVPFSVDDLLVAASFGGAPATVAARDVALAAVGLAGMRRRLFSRLSGGERQRVLLARASLVDAPLWLFDEPTAAVDRAGEEDLLRHIRTLVTRDGRAVIYVSHHLEALRPHADRLLALDGAGGAVVTAGGHCGAAAAAMVSVR